MRKKLFMNRWFCTKGKGEQANSIMNKYKYKSFDLWTVNEQNGDVKISDSHANIKDIETRESGWKNCVFAAN